MSIKSQVVKNHSHNLISFIKNVPSFIYTVRKFSGSILPERWLEVAIAVDYTLISFHGREKVEQYVLALMNIVSETMYSYFIKSVATVQRYAHKTLMSLKVNHLSI